uniref:Boule homolog, RNA binding protein n=1 Tax=Falco tinnunculus TaxID=100819 RepID=A0A8C4XQN3_FALTI
VTAAAGAGEEAPRGAREGRRGPCGAGERACASEGAASLAEGARRGGGKGLLRPSPAPLPAPRPPASRRSPPRRSLSAVARARGRAEERDACRQRAGAEAAAADRWSPKARYGFITFETQEDAQKILQEAKKLNYKDKKLNIGPAIRKQQLRSPRSTIIPEAGTMYLTTSSGYPYIYHNGVAYFHMAEVASLPQPWPSRSVSSPPVMVAQPVYQSPTYHYQAPTQCLPSQWQWSVPQSPASPPSLLYLQPSEVIYQPVGITQESGCIPAPLLVEAAVPELYSDHGVQAPHHQPYAQSTIAIPAPTLWSIHY